VLFVNNFLIRVAETSARPPKMRQTAQGGRRLAGLRTLR